MESQAARTPPVERSSVPKQCRYIPSLSSTEKLMPQESVSTFPKSPCGLAPSVKVNPVLKAEA